MAEAMQLFPESDITVASNWVVAEGVVRREYTIPDVVLWHVVRSLKLDEPHQLGIDPMCGNGTNLSFINEVGGNCYGIELDERTYEIARFALSQIKPFDRPGWLRGEEPKVVRGNCTEVSLCDSNGSPVPARYIYTSIPFRELLDGTLGDRIGPAFSNMLLPPGSLSFIVIDSADYALRDGVTMYPAAATVEYFERSGFSLLDSIAFKITNAPPGCDDQFTELMFVRDSELNTWERINPRPLSGGLAPHSNA